MMFPDELDLRAGDGYSFKTLGTFRFFGGVNYPDVTVPDFFETDLISSPRLTWVLVPPHGRAKKAAVIHDYLYKYQIVHRKQADDIYRAGCIELGVKKCRISIMYRVLRWFGWYQWNKYTKELEK